MRLMQTSDTIIQLLFSFDLVTFLTCVFSVLKTSNYYDTYTHASPGRDKWQ